MVYVPAQYDIFLPGIFNNYPYREVEPNNSPGAANGPIALGTDVFGSPDDDWPGDERDWFSFNYDGSGTIVIDVTGFLAVAQVNLYKDGNYAAPLASDSDQGSGVYHVEYNGAAGAGLYKLWLFVPPSHPKNNGDYILTVTNP
jgi:hypothetical protein